MNDDDNIEGRIHGPQFGEDERDNLLARLVFMLILAFMISVAQTLLGALAIVQYIILLLNKGEPNERLADFGTTLGVWVAKAARYQAAASNVKPWPWTDFD